MTADAQIPGAVAVQVLVGPGLVQTMAGQTVQGLAVARIQDVLTQRVGDGVLVRVAHAAQIHRVVDEKHWPVTAVRAMAGIAAQIGVGLEVAGLPCGASPGVVAGETGVRVVGPVQQIAADRFSWTASSWQSPHSSPWVVRSANGAAEPDGA